MAFPAAWPPRVPNGLRSIRFFTSGTGTANFSDNAFMFLDGAGANVYSPTPIVPYGTDAVVNNPLNPTGTGITTAPPLIHPMLWSGNIRICNDGSGVLEFSFDGVNIHGRLLTAEVLSYRNRYEAGIAIRGAGLAFRVEAW